MIISLIIYKLFEHYQILSCLTYSTSVHPSHLISFSMPLWCVFINHNCWCSAFLWFGKPCGLLGRNSEVIHFSLFHVAFFLRFFLIRAGMMGWLFINLSLFAKIYQAGNANLSVILYQLFCVVCLIWFLLKHVSQKVTNACFTFLCSFTL